MKHFTENEIRPGVIDANAEYSITWTNGLRIWYYGFTKHRIDGPAYIDDGHLEWYVNGKFARTNKEFQQMSGISDEDLFVMVLIYGDVY